MKIGIVSIHSAHNYGSVLQAYALQEELKKFSNDVEIIDYRPEYLERQYKLFSIKVYNRYQGLINKIVHLGWRTLMLKKRLDKYHKFEKFIKSNYHLTKKVYKTYDELEKENFNYDIVFCGSDQIWNTDITNGFDKVYYLGFSNNFKKTSYAASVGRSNIEEKYEKDYEKYLKDFNSISLREESSKNIIKKYTNKDIDIVLDPTMLIDSTKWDTLANESNMNILNKYILIYQLEDNKEFDKIVNSISKYLNLKIISLNKKKKYSNEINMPFIGPNDFLYLFKNAEFIITNSFHGTVFSLLYNKRNCIIPHKQTGSRMSDLMNKLGLSDRVIKEYSELNLESISKDIDYKKVNKILNSERSKAEEYIKKALG